MRWYGWTSEVGGGGEFRIQIENIPQTTSWRQLKDFVRAVAVPRHADVFRDDLGPYGVVELASMDDAAAAVLGLDGYLFDGAPVSVRFEKSIRDAGHVWLSFAASVVVGLLVWAMWERGARALRRSAPRATRALRRG